MESDTATNAPNSSAGRHYQSFQSTRNRENRMVPPRVNGSEEDDASALQVVIEEADECWDEIKSRDLCNFDMMTTAVIKKKVNKLFQVRRQMQRT